MSIDWNWIFQRPQIIAQHLQENYDITVVFPRSILKWRPSYKVAFAHYLADYRILWTFPYQEKNRFIGRMSSWINRRIFRDIYQFQCVWIGYPLYRRYVPGDYQGKLIYDCMDNHEAMYPYQKGLKKLLEQDRILAETCDVLFVSGRKLGCRMARLVKEAYMSFWSMAC